MSRRATILMSCVMWVCLTVPTEGVFGQVFVEDSSAAAQGLDRALERLSAGEPEEAARIVQVLLDEHGSALMELEGGLYTTTTRVVAQRFVELPLLREAYQSIHGAEARGLLDRAGNRVEELERIFARYSLTAEGLEAGLRLSGLLIESGQAGHAQTSLARLSGHPALSAQMDRWLMLREAAATVMPGGRSEVLTGLSASPAQGLPEPMPAPLWSVKLHGGAETFVTQKYHLDASQGEIDFRIGRYLNVVPAVSGGRLYFNDGLYVLALEPMSGRMLWRQRIAEDDYNGGNYIRSSNWMPGGLDMSGVAAVGERVVALGGYGSMSPPNVWVESPSVTRAACLDALSGRVLWSVVPGELGADFAEGYWYGFPVIDGDRVYLQIRRRQQTQFQDAFVVALSMRDGAMIWRRHLASLAVVRRSTTPAYSYLLAEGGWLYVETRLGTVARLSASDGSVDWLASFDRKPMEFVESPRNPWEATRPVMTGSGLVVHDASEKVIRVLEAQSGRALRTIADQAWSWPEYFVALPGGDLLSVGRKVVRVSGQTLEPVWSHDLAGSLPRGRVAVSARFVYVPMDDGLHPLDIENGEARATVPVAIPVNLLVLEGQVIGVHRTRAEDADGGRGTLEARSYATWEFASEELRARAAAETSDPSPLIDLAWLSLEHGHGDELLEAIGAAAQRVAGQRAGPARRYVFAASLELAGRLAVDSTVAAGEVFLGAAQLMDDAEQEVAYRLALGDFHRGQGRVEEAVEQYQSILLDRVCRAQVFRDVEGARSAELVAHERLRGLVKEWGAGVYARYEGFAVRRYEELSDQRDVWALRELAHSHPFASVAPDALLEAARITAESGKAVESVGLLRGMRLFDASPRQAARALAAEVSLLEGLKEYARARRALRMMTVGFPGEGVEVESGTAVLADWDRRLRDAQDAGRRGRVATFPLPLPRYTWAGRLMGAVAQDASAPSLDGFLVRESDAVSMYHAGDLSIAWRVPVGAGGVELISADARYVFLWEPESEQLRAMDSGDGLAAWEQAGVIRQLVEVDPSRSTPVAARGLEEEVPWQIQRIRMQARGRFEIDSVEGMRDDLPVLSGPAFGVNDLSVAVADGAGRVIVFDSRTGETRWRVATPVKRMTHFELDERHVVVAGEDSEGEIARPLFCLYDATTGRLLYRSHDGVGALQRLRGVSLMGDGRVGLLSLNRVELFDPALLRHAWVSAGPGADARFMDEVGGGEGRIVVRTEEEGEGVVGGDLIFIDAGDGRLVRRVSMRGVLEGKPRVVEDRGEWFAWSESGCVALGGDGHIVWRDAVMEPGRFLSLALTDTEVWVLATTDEDRRQGAKVRRVYVFDRATGRLVHEQRVEADKPLDSILVMGEKVLLSGEGVTAVFTAPE